MDGCISIRSTIGKRIAEARTNLELSQGDLAQKTGFGKTRISNWETGFRTPKLEESKVLEKFLGVPAPYLLGLTNSKETTPSSPQSLYPHAFPSIPIYTEQDIIQRALAPNSESPKDTNTVLPLLHHQKNLVEKKAFAFQLLDNSMAPEYRKNDIIVFDPTVKPRHNDHVLALVRDSHEVIFRRYFMDNSQSQHPIVKLIPNHTDWFDYSINNSDDIVILGVKSDTQRVFA